MIDIDPSSIAAGIVIGGGISTILTRLFALAHETAEDEDPDSHGGHLVTDHELLQKNEARLRKVHRTIGHWLHRLETLRKPRVAVVGGRG